MLDQTSLLERQAELMKVDFKRVIMRGRSRRAAGIHAKRATFARGEPLEDITASEKAAATKLILPLRTHPDTSAWNDLLVSDLTNMKVPGSIWSYRNGLLTATEDQNLWTKATHARRLRVSISNSSSSPEPTAASSSTTATKPTGCPRASKSRSATTAQRMAGKARQLALRRLLRPSGREQEHRQTRR